MTGTPMSLILFTNGRKKMLKLELFKSVSKTQDFCSNAVRAYKAHSDERAVALPNACKAELARKSIIT